MKTINDLWTILGKDKEHLDTCITESAKSYVDLSNHVSNYILNSGGKRIRPLALLLLSRAMGYNGREKYQLATAIEFIHTATLLHDDVVDESKIRRNNPTANYKFGNSAAVLVGDFLYTRAFQLISKNLRATEVISDATNELAMGEVMQLMNISNLDLTENEYLQVINLKTAVLFSAACKLSSILAKCNSLSKNVASYGKHLGIAFQIADDVLDYVGDVKNIGKNIGDDLAEKKITLPIIHTIGQASNSDKKQLKNIIKNGEIDKIELVISILNKYKSIEYARKIANNNANIAKSAIAKIPDNKYKDGLIKLTEIAVERLQ